MISPNFMGHVAVICSRGLGDALLSLILSHNLRLAGKYVTTFSTLLCELKDWFPDQSVLPLPSQEMYSQVFSPFDTLIGTDHSPLAHACGFGNHVVILKERTFDKTCTMVENLQRICQRELALPYFDKEPGFHAPKDLQWQRHKKRIVIHPLSTDDQKNWPAKKFIQLGHQLKQHGFDPHYCMSPCERESWVQRVPETELPIFPTLNALARFVYESGAMIGNDSGIGHLASLFHIPTVSLFARKSYSKLWRPGWGPGRVVSPFPLLPGAHLKQKYWKQLLPVWKVLNAHII